jgi:GGDEF domain-containing protein
MVTVTLSYGVVVFPDAGSDAFELYRKADAMLYLSKEAGRNLCHVWNYNGEPLRITPPAPAG